MTLKMTAAHSSRITKPSTKNPLLRRTSSSSPFSSLPRRRPSSQGPSRKTDKSPAPANNDSDEDDSTERLEDHGLITALATDLRLRDVAQQIQYIQTHTFDKIPERSGFNSTRIAETLNYQRNLPPIITVAHVHALSRNPTATEREIAELVQGGVVRKINIPGRGIGTAAVGECLVLSEWWIQMVRECKGLHDDIKEKYITHLLTNPTATTLPTLTFTPTECASLVRAGLLTSSNTQHPLGSFLSPPTTTHPHLSTLSTSGSRAPAGSLAAVGGSSAIYDSGGGGAGSGLSAPSSISQQAFALSLPSVGVYLKLLTSARAHLVALLAKTRYKECTMDMLRERWDGGLANPVRKSVKRQGLEGVAMAVKTKKWKGFFGVRFQWVLEECVGAGLVECFETGSVGVGVRLCS